MKNIKYLLAFLALLGCSSVALYKSPQVQAKNEEMARTTYQYPKKDVFDACLTSLKNNGWNVSTSNYATGEISGTRQTEPDVMAGAESGPQTATVSVVEVLPGQTEVKITAGISSPNPGGAAAGGKVKVKNMPRMCVPLLDNIHETLVKAPKPGGK